MRLSNEHAACEAFALAAGVVVLNAVTAHTAEVGTSADLPDGAMVHDPNLIWQVLLGGFVVLALLCAIAIWALAALRDLQDKQARRNILISRALNHVRQGVVMVDGKRQVVFLNEAYLDIYDLERTDLPPDLSYSALLALRRKRGTLDLSDDEFYEMAGSPAGYIADLSDGRAIQIKYNPLPNGGAVATHEDVTAQRHLSRELAETKHFLELVVDNLPVGLIVKNASDGRYMVVNRIGEVILNYPRDKVMGLTAADVYAPDMAARVACREAEAMESRTVMTEDVSVSTGDGLRLFQSRYVTVRDDAGTPKYLIKSHEDVTDRRETEARMAYMAYHDALTDLPNRAAFLQTLAQMIEACASSGEPFAVLSLDLDGLQDVNDVFGQTIGDKLLIEVSRRLEARASGSMIARLGGDEFGLIVDGADDNTVKVLASLLSSAMTQEFRIEGKTVLSGVTIGISLFPRDGADAASLLANAGAALFRAKVKSPGSIGIFEPEMDRLLRDRRVLHHDLSMAIRNGELMLHYQPQVRSAQSLAGADFTGFEALARWIHPTRGFVPPGDFIPLAEESGLIVEMGEWILREACREAASWPAPLQIAVNLSPAQFVHGDLVGLVHSILLETGLQAGRLELEITEGVLIEDFERGLTLLRRLKALGVRISMDDFGSGYSSLTYLQAFPFDKIKIDRAFVMNLGQNVQSAAIVRAVIGLGHGLDISIVAEGVETLEQLRFLDNEGCDCVQGYYIGRPAPIDKYAALIGRATPAVEAERMTG